MNKNEIYHLPKTKQKWKTFKTIKSTVQISEKSKSSDQDSHV